MKKQILRTLALIMVLATVGMGSAMAQKKEHFIIHNPDPKIPMEVYMTALENKDLDQFRFLDSRRTIKFSDSQTTVELYSANELMTTYGKPVSPLTIKNPAKAQNLEFILFPEYKAIKEKFIQ